VYIDSKPGGTPFYVGIGKFRRVSTHVRNILHSRICEKYEGCIREIVFSGDRQVALEEEKRLISMFGRMNNDTGILANLTDGGDGGTGIVITDARKKIASIKMKKKYSDPVIRSEISKRTTELFTRPDVRERHMEGVKRAWSDPTNKEFHRKQLIIAMSNPDVQKRKLESFKATANTESFKKKKSERSKEIMARPEVNAKLRASLKVSMNRPSTKAKMKIISAECQNRPDVIKKKSEAISLLHDARKVFIDITGYSGKYRHITKLMIFQALALEEKATTQNDLRNAIKEYRKNKSNSS
jgi:hypothetical protein